MENNKPGIEGHLHMQSPDKVPGKT